MGGESGWGSWSSFPPSLSGVLEEFGFVLGGEGFGFGAKLFLGGFVE